MDDASGRNDGVGRALELAVEIEQLLEESGGAITSDVVQYECRVAHALTLGLVDQLASLAQVRDRS